MRQINATKVTELVKKLCIEANYYLSEDIVKGLREARQRETFQVARDIIDILSLNAEIARNENMPICQDTGMAVIFIELGQDVHITGGSLSEAINEGVREGYKEGFLRKSVVGDPLRRVNTKDNTPAIIHYDVVSGDKLKITVVPKGFGSEIMSQLKILVPADGVEGLKNFVINVVKQAGPNACPPIVVGVGIGGNFELSAYLAKRALLRPINIRNGDSFYKNLEEELLEKINSLGIGPQGFGGRTTALAVNIETYATHIGALPVAVNLNCHATRHIEGELL